MKGDVGAIQALARKPRPDIRLYLIFGTDDGGNAAIRTGGGAWHQQG